eukprot:COSAG06_NODE_17618_length_930_cov_1.211793_2_plen_73_part_00
MAHRSMGYSVVEAAAGGLLVTETGAMITTGVVAGRTGIEIDEQEPGQGTEGPQATVVGRVLTSPQACAPSAG